MTTTDDVIRQIETALNDTHYPPTPKQKEILTTILRKVNPGTRDFGERTCEGRTG